MHSGAVHPPTCLQDSDINPGTMAKLSSIPDRFPTSELRPQDTFLLSFPTQVGTPEPPAAREELGHTGMGASPFLELEFPFWLNELAGLLPDTLGGRMESQGAQRLRMW